MKNDRTGKNKKDAVTGLWVEVPKNDRSEMVDQINTNQYQDELIHKIEVYDGVKATLKLCRTMIVALDTTSASENWSRAQLLSYLDLAQSYAMLAAVDVDLEQRGLGK